jgi:hypothetical protein
MVRTQIQLPDEVYARARRIADAREISFAELARRGLEYILSVYSPEPEGVQVWNPPKPRHLGWKGLTEDQLKGQARLSPVELAFSRKR